MIAPFEGLSVVVGGSGIAVRLAGRTFAGYGARVVRADLGTIDTDAASLYYDAGVEVRATGAATDIIPLLADADVFLTDLDLSVRAEAGLDRTALAASNPRLVAASVSPYGESGPRAGHRATALTEFASGGQMSITGDADREPLVTYGNQAEVQTGYHVYSATMVALLDGRRTGRGHYVEISVQEAQVSALEGRGPTAFNGDAFAPGYRGRSGNGTRPLWHQYKCKDGYAGVFVNPPNLKTFFSAIGRPDLWERRDDQEFLAVGLQPIIAEWFRERTRAEVYAAAVTYGAPFSFVATPTDLLGFEPIERAGLWHEVEHPTAGTVRVPGMAVTADDLPFGFAVTPR